MFYERPTEIAYSKSLYFLTQLIDQNEQLIIEHYTHNHIMKNHVDKRI